MKPNVGSNKISPSQSFIRQTCSSLIYSSKYSLKCVGEKMQNNIGKKNFVSNLFSVCDFNVLTHEKLPINWSSLIKDSVNIKLIPSDQRIWA